MKKTQHNLHIRSYILSNFKQEVEVGKYIKEIEDKLNSLSIFDIRHYNKRIEELENKRFLLNLNSKFDTIFRKVDNKSLFIELLCEDITKEKRGED